MKILKKQKNRHYKNKTKDFKLPEFSIILRPLLLFISVGAFVTSCVQSDVCDEMTQGVIEYEIRYKENNSSGIPAQVLPRKMVMTFNDNYVMQRIDGFMGLFSVFHISCRNNETNNTYIKIGPYKYVYVGSPDEMAAGFGGEKTKVLKQEEGTYRIAGLEARKVLVSCPDSTALPFSVYYTKEIPISNINKNNPYEGIDGVMLDFILELNGLKMHLVAKNAKFREIDEKVFIHDNYRRINRNEMDEIISSLFE